MTNDLLIIGGGPSGMMAAIRASERKARVVLLEKNNKLGAKLLATGHGRCNITNVTADSKAKNTIYGLNGKFLFSAFNKFGAGDAIDFFAGLGVEIILEDQGRVFPKSNKASDVQTALIKKLKKNNVKILYNAEVKSVVASQDMIEKVVLTDGREISSKNFLIATGGKSYPETGSTGCGYGWLASIGHTVKTPRPSLTPIVVKERIVKSLEGLSLKSVELIIFRDNKKIACRNGDIIFTSDGLSGPAILELSRDEVFAISDEKKKLNIQIDFLPDVNIIDLDRQIQKDFHSGHNKFFKNYLAGIWPPKLVPVIIELSGINENKQVNGITRNERQKLIDVIKKFNLEIKELKGFDKAMITAGGVDVKEIDPRTMQSKLFKNLYLAGEILDVDGPTGGYNLQICWSTGWVAGESVKF